MADCRDIITSEDTIDFITEFAREKEAVEEQYREYCPQFTNYRYVILYADKNSTKELSVKNYSYSSIPKVYGLMDTTAVAATGSLRLQNQTGFNLTGKGVIVGFIDTGIDYNNSAFKTVDGRSRIIEIWDQTDNTGDTPENIQYGSVYNNEQINSAINSENPREIVPEVDENGHGTFLAGVACGSYNQQEDFIGAASESDIAVVKLKPAKKLLKDFFLIEGNEPAFAENDIMLGVTYLRDLSLRKNKSLVVVLGVGTGSGERRGGSPLSQQLNDLGQIIGNCVVVPSGNEGNARLHYSGSVSEGSSVDVELKVGANDRGFSMELWGSTPDVFSISFISPLGETVPRIPARVGLSDTLNFLLEGTTIDINYSLVESGSGSELIFLRFIAPTEGIWIIRVFGNNILKGNFNLWGNLRQFGNEDTYFLKPNPDETITTPGNVENVITTGAYNNQTLALYPSSGRGFTADNRIKPDFVAPGVNVFGPGINNNFVRKSGTSIASALTGGCCAQILQWGIVEGNDLYLKTNYIKNYLIRGATRDRDIVYPSTGWGYGRINVFDSFSILTRT